MNLEKIEKDIKRTSIIAISLMFVVPLTYFSWFYLYNGLNLSLDSGIWGTFGDFVGGILNPIIAFLAFYWLTKSIGIQKQELEETKKALVDSSKAQSEQALTLKKQRFEDTFFALLDQHNRALFSLSNTALSESTFSTGGTQVKNQQTALSKIKNSVTKCEDLKSAKVELMKNNDLIGHYFRILYQLLKFIATDCPHGGVGITFKERSFKNRLITREEKNYSNIVRAFLNNDITQILAINCYCDDEDMSFYKFKLLIERYSFLEHMPFKVKSVESALLKETTNIYKESAFGNSDYLKEIIKN